MYPFCPALCGWMVSKMTSLAQDKNVLVMSFECRVDQGLRFKKSERQHEVSTSFPLSFPYQLRHLASEAFGLLFTGKVQAHLARLSTNAHNTKMDLLFLTVWSTFLHFMHTFTVHTVNFSTTSSTTCFMVMCLPVSCVYPFHLQIKGVLSHA